MKQNLMDVLLPRPRQIEPAEGDLALGDSPRIIVLSQGAEQAHFAGERLAALIEEEFGLRVPVVVREGEGYQLFLAAADGDGERRAGRGHLDARPRRLSARDRSGGSAGASAVRAGPPLGRDDAPPVLARARKGSSPLRASASPIGRATAGAG